MDSQFKSCQKCGATLPPGTLVCPRCNSPAPDTFFFSPDPAAMAPASSSSGHGARFWIGLVAIIGGSLCSCLAVAMIGFYIYYTFGGMKSSQSISAITETPSSEAPLVQSGALSPAENPVIQITPATEEPLLAPHVTPDQLAPAENPPATSPSGGGDPRFFDDFSNINGAWKQVNNDDYTMGYFQHGNYAITLNVPNKMAVSKPPYAFSRPVKGLLINVKVTGEGGNGFYGLLCHFQDAKNYYRVSFSGTQYAVDKIVDGQRRELTQPFWKKLIAYQPEADGYLHVSLACTDGRLQILVNDVGQEIVDVPDLSEGDVALFAASGDKKDQNGLYEGAYFDDFSAELP